MKASRLLPSASAAGRSTAIKIFPALEKAGMLAVSTEGHSGKSLKNLVNSISGKDRLICKFLGIGGRKLPQDAEEQIKVLFSYNRKCSKPH